MIVNRELESNHLYIQGWFVRPVKAEIKARDVRNCFNREHPACFVLELEQIAPAMSEVSLEVIVTQSGPSISQDNKHSMVKLSLSTDQSSSQRSSSGCSSLSGKIKMLFDSKSCSET